MSEQELLWLQAFDSRQQAEIRFARLYAAQFRHGTDGHNAKMIIAQMAAMLDDAESRLSEPPSAAIFKLYQQMS